MKLRSEGDKKERDLKNPQDTFILGQRKDASSSDTSSRVVMSERDAEFGVRHFWWCSIPLTSAV